MSGTLSTKLWLEAYFRQLDIMAVAHYVSQRGEAERGTVALAFTGADRRCRILIQARDGEILQWLEVFVGPEAEAREYLQRLAGRDPDMWVVEIDGEVGLKPGADFFL